MKEATRQRILRKLEESFKNGLEGRWNPEFFRVHCKVDPEILNKMEWGSTCTMGECEEVEASFGRFYLTHNEGVTHISRA